MIVKRFVGAILLAFVLSGCTEVFYDGVECGPGPTVCERTCWPLILCESWHPYDGDP